MRPARQRPGFSLLELLLSMTLLAVGIAGAFFVFNLGTYYFRVGLSRQSVQVQGRRAMTWLEHDIRQTCIDGIQVQPLTATVSGLGSQQRNAISMPGMDNWNDPANFNSSNGNPSFNRYVVYYANSASDGSFFRLELIPGSGIPGRPWTWFSLDFASPLSATLQNPQPKFNMADGDSTPAVCRRLVDNCVLSFKAGTANINQTTVVQCTLLLRAQTAGQSAGQSRDETLQFNMYAPAYNKLP